MLTSIGNRHSIPRQNHKQVTPPTPSTRRLHFHEINIATIPKDDCALPLSIPSLFTVGDPSASALTALRHFRLLPRPFPSCHAVPRQHALRALDEGSKLAHSLSSAFLYFRTFSLFRLWRKVSCGAISTTSKRGKELTFLWTSCQRVIRNFKREFYEMLEKDSEIWGQSRRVAWSIVRPASQNGQ